MNRVEISGRLTRPPELRYTKKGVPMLRGTVVVDSEPFYDSQLDAHVTRPNFVSVQFWGKMAEAIAERDLPKGTMVYVLGQIDQSEWEKADGTKESKTRVKGMFLIELEPQVDESFAYEPAEAEEPPF